MFENQGKNSSTAQKEALTNLTRIQPGQMLLNGAKRLTLLREIRILTALEDARYHSLCEQLLTDLASAFQQLPGTDNSFYTEAGGLMDHALYRTEATMQLFKKFLILDASGILSEEQKLWQYVLYSAALLKGIGKLYVDFKIHIYDNAGLLLAAWNPLETNLTSIGSFYQYTFQKDTDNDFRSRVNLLLAKMLMPASGFAWIASQPKALAVWLALLQDDLLAAGTLGALLSRADALAIQRYINELLIKKAAIRNARQRQAGTFRTEMPETLAEKEHLLGLTFLQWLKQALAEGKLILNQSPLYTVPGGIFFADELYKLFLRDNPEYTNWQTVQKSFLSLGLHESNKARFEQSTTQKMQNGDLFVHYTYALPEQVKVHNAGQTSTCSAIELSYIAQFVQIQAALNAISLAHLGPDGRWELQVNNKAETQFGTGHRG